MQPTWRFAEPILPSPSTSLWFLTIWVAQVAKHWGHTLCDLDSLLERSGGKPTTSYSAFLNHFEKEERAHPRHSVLAPQQMPPLCGDVPDGLAIPSLEDLGCGQPTTAVILPGGESEALRRMQEHLKRDGWIASFEKPNTNPTEIDPSGERTRSTTALSPYLKFGCLSSRLLYEQLSQVHLLRTFYCALVVYHC